jgi:hypothetical protein
MTGTSWHTHWWILELIPVFFLRLAPSSWALPFPNQHVYIFTGTSEAPQIAFRSIKATVWNGEEAHRFGAVRWFL